MSRPIYPFTAIVGQETMRLALLLHAVDPALGGVLVRGRKGTAKSTAVRALAGLLPEITCVEGCPFNCDPCDAMSACDECAARMRVGETLPALCRPVPVVELPVGATEDRVAGSLNLETAIQSGQRQLEPGLLARANRGVLYIDEVNLLGDHLVDLLLDAAAMGRNYVEREGISVSHPARVMLVGTMNPEEGDLRPQLLDRFALAVEVDGLADPALRVAAVRNRVAFERDPEAFIASCADTDARERTRLTAAREMLRSVAMPAKLQDLIAHVCVAFGVDGLRADLAMHRAAVALAAYEGHGEVTEADIRAVAPLVLAHRRRRGPFEEPGMDDGRLDEAIEQFTRGGSSDGVDFESVEGAAHLTPGPSPARGGERGAEPSSEYASRANKTAHAHALESQNSRPTEARSPSADSPQRPSSSPARNGYPADASSPSAAPPQPHPPFPTGKGARGLGQRPAAPGTPPRMALPIERGHQARETMGRRNGAREGRRGAVVRTVPLAAGTEFAVAATLAAAAPHQHDRDGAREGGSPAVLLRREDLRGRVRRGRSGSLVLFVVDASGSMGARQRMSATKGAVLGLLLDAYRKRDQVGMVAFRGSSAELVLPPTNSVELAQRRLAALPTGGRTPLAAGLTAAQTAITRAMRGPRPLRPLVVLVSDGRANSAPPGIDPWQAAHAASEALRVAGWRSVVLDTEEGRSAAGFAHTVAGWLGAAYLRLDGTPIDAARLGVE